MPDKGGREEYFEVLVHFRNILIEPEAREVYNKRGLDAAKGKYQSVTFGNLTFI